ncbi:MAG: family 16 glycoside hydrolase [Planctomycetota bacterium]
MHDSFRWLLVHLVAPLLVTSVCVGQSPVSLKALLIDGQNNHKWPETTPQIEAALEAGGLCDVTVATSPPQGAAMEGFQPSFSDYDVIVLNYNGDEWSPSTQSSLEAYVAGGGGMVSVHAADNSFPKWEAYNRMIGLGGWKGRNEASGPYVRWNDVTKKFTRDMSKGSGGKHGKRTPFTIVVREPSHPITVGLPRSFMQTNDELYGKLRGPAENMHVLATAYSDPATGGTGEHEPILMTIQFGEGRVFHTTLGHDVKAMQGLAFQMSLRRGTQWAATGSVALPPIEATVLTSELASEGDPSDAAKAESPKTDSAETPPDLNATDWIRLFDGTSLEGWTQKNGTASYRVTDGSIVGKTAVGSPNSFLCTDQRYDDFELTFEVNVDPGLNSGVQIRSDTREDGGRVYGPQVEIETAPGEAGYIYGEATGRGWITKEQPIKDAYQNGQFNRFRVRAVGDRIQTWLGDQSIADIVDPESAAEGFIGLQVHRIKPDAGPFEVRWRDVRIRPL